MEIMTELNNVIRAQSTNLISSDSFMTFDNIYNDIKTIQELKSSMQLSMEVSMGDRIIILFL